MEESTIGWAETQLAIQTLTGIAITAILWFTLHATEKAQPKQEEQDSMTPEEREWFERWQRDRDKKA